MSTKTMTTVVTKAVKMLKETMLITMVQRLMRMKKSVLNPP